MGGKVRAWQVDVARRADDILTNGETAAADGARLWRNEVYESDETFKQKVNHGRRKRKGWRTTPCAVMRQPCDYAAINKPSL